MNDIVCIHMYSLMTFDLSFLFRVSLSCSTLLGLMTIAGIGPVLVPKIVTVEGPVPDLHSTPGVIEVTDVIITLPLPLVDGVTRAPAVLVDVPVLHEGTRVPHEGTPAVLEGSHGVLYDVGLVVPCGDVPVVPGGGHAVPDVTDHVLLLVAEGNGPTPDPGPRPPLEKRGRGSEGVPERKERVTNVPRDLALQVQAKSKIDSRFS